MIPLPSLALHCDTNGRLVLVAGDQRAVYPALRSAVVDKTWTTPHDTHEEGAA